MHLCKSAPQCVDSYRSQHALWFKTPFIISYSPLSFSLLESMVAEIHAVTRRLQHGMDVLVINAGGHLQCARADLSRCDCQLSPASLSLTVMSALYSDDFNEGIVCPLLYGSDIFLHFKRSLGLINARDELFI